MKKSMQDVISELNDELKKCTLTVSANGREAVSINYTVFSDERLTEKALEIFVVFAELRPGVRITDTPYFENSFAISKENPAESFANILQDIDRALHADTLRDKAKAMGFDPEDLLNISMNPDWYLVMKTLYLEKLREKMAETDLCD